MTWLTMVDGIALGGEKKETLNLRHVAKKSALSELCFVTISLIRERFLQQQAESSGQKAIT